jgi:hypothetical protein
MEIVAYDPYISEEVAERLQVEWWRSGRTLARSDVITVHALTEGQGCWARCVCHYEGRRRSSVPRGAIVDKRRFTPRFR